MAIKLTYAPNGTSLGDIMTQTTYLPREDGVHESISSWLRVKQSLNLTGKTYDYSSAYVTNAKGKDEDFTIMGNTFNIAKIKAYDFDKMFSANLFCVELNANSFKYKLRLDNGQYTGFDTPMTIDGNKVTLDMSAINPVLRKVEMHMFQDANDTQVQFYMHTDAFINYFANMEVYTLIMEGKINQSDAAAVEKVFTDMEARVESINVSFVMKARK
jgi:ribosomal protein L23